MLEKPKQNIDIFLAENPPEKFMPEALQNGLITPKEMRKHYSYLRTVANKRLKNFVGSEFEDAKSYIKNVGKFVPLSEINNERELMFKLYEVSKFVRARSSSVTGLRQMRNDTIETAHERGMTWLNKENIKQFGEYMDYLRAKYGAKQFDSERAQELFGQAVKKEIDPNEIAEDFGFWRQHADELAEMPKIRNKKMRSGGEYKRILLNR